jgi:archaemetzincin
LALIPKKLPGARPSIARPITSIDEAFNSIRKQYHSTRIIAILENHPSLSSFQKKLGITALDLYNPGMDGERFVIGESRSPGSSAIVSTYRLNCNSNEFDSRVKKEVIHELGHMIGLTHCSDPECVMCHSVTVSDTDTKRIEYCTVCRRSLEALEG